VLGGSHGIRGYVSVMAALKYVNTYFLIKGIIFLLKIIE
jgi:hypothetical protein